MYKTLEEIRAKIRKEISAGGTAPQKSKRITVKCQDAKKKQKSGKALKKIESISKKSHATKKQNAKLKNIETHKLIDFRGKKKSGVTKKDVRMRTSYLPPIVSFEQGSLKSSTLKKSVKEILSDSVVKCYSSTKNSARNSKHKK